MRTFDEILTSARDGSPFSNGTSGHMWESEWCGRCLHDKPFREGTASEGCPIMLAALMGKTPIEWLPQPGIQDYHCVEFRDEDDPGGREPEPVPDPPGQDELFPREPYTGVRMYVQPSLTEALRG